MVYGKYSSDTQTYHIELFQMENELLHLSGRHVMNKSDSMDDADDNEPTDELIEQVEQDTADTEDIVDLMKTLLPNGDFPSSASQFGLHYNMKIFHGWVKQPSACCAASSLAGAWNCLADVSRHDAEALNHIDILNIYRSIMANSIEKKKKSFERCLGGSIDFILGRLEVEFCYPPGSPTPKCPPLTKVAMINSIKRIINEELPVDSKGNAEDENTAMNVMESVSASHAGMQLLHELLQNEKTAQPPSSDLVLTPAAPMAMETSQGSVMATVQGEDKVCYRQDKIPYDMMVFPIMSSIDTCLS